MGCIEAWHPCGPGDVEEIGRGYVAELRALWEILLPFSALQLCCSHAEERYGGSLNEVNVDFTHATTTVDTLRKTTVPPRFASNQPL